MASKKPADAPVRALTADDLKRVPWRSIGPAFMGGRIADMCFKPGDHKTFYVGYASGGLWRTANMGTTFEPLFDDQETSSIGSVVCCDAPDGWAGWEKSVSKADRAKQGKGKIIWLGTGEGNGRNSSSWGNGVYRSTDEGKTWKHLGLEQTHDIPRIAVDPKDPDTCYVAALGHLWGYNPERGVYKTTDGGATWERVLYIDEKTGCCDIILDPSDPKVVYAAMYMRLRKPWSMLSGGPEGGIYRSTDAGKTWKKLSGGLPTQTGRIGLDIFPDDTKKLIAVVESTERGANSIRDDRMRGGGVFRSDDGGETWRKLSVRSPRAFYFSKIKFDPKSDQRVYLLGWTTEVSDDGGDTFRGGVADILHADHHAILVNPSDPDHLIIGTDGGAYQSMDKGKTWDFLNTIAVGQFYNIALDNSEPYRVMGGLQDNGTCLGPSATNRNEKKNDARSIPDTGITNADWLDVFWGDGFHCAFDPTDSNSVYAEWQGGNISRLDLFTGETKLCAPEAREGESRIRYNWNSPFFVSTHDPSVVYHAGNYVFKLTKRGDDWERISPDLTTRDPERMDTQGSNAETFCTVVSLTESPLSRGELWAGSDDGLIQLTRDDGKSWENVTPDQVSGRYVSRLHASKHTSGRCYASIDGHRTDDFEPCVLVSHDFGKSWKDITANLPKNRCAMVVREDLFNPDVLYVGTEGALFLSLDAGATWTKFNGKALPTVPVYDIQQHARESDLVLGTHGRSIYVLDDARWISELAAEVMAKPIHLFNISPARPKYTFEIVGSWTHKMFRAANPPQGLKISYWISAYANEEVKLTIKDEKGVIQKKLAGSNAPGFNRVVWDLEPEEWLRVSDKGEEPWIQKFYVRPGKYTVTLEMGKQKCEGTFEVLPLLKPKTSH
ncbi:MAG: hypothetical protein JNM85_10500 [Chthonomonas sp.]|nr:hypothetical protein [Chthonomonas sp.]